MAFQLAYRPKNAQAQARSPSTAVSSAGTASNTSRNANYSLPGFILTPREPDQRLRRFLEDPPFRYCLINDDRMATTQNAIILLFRTLKFYGTFKDMCVYMYAVARDIHEEIDIIRDTVRSFVKCREEFLNTRPSTQPAVPSHASENEKLICKLADEYISNTPDSLEVTPQRYDFFEEVRRRWTILIDSPGAIDPEWVFPPEVDRERDAERRGDDSSPQPRAKGPSRNDRDRGRSRRSLSLERQARCGLRRDRSVTPERGGDRSRSPVRRRSPLRYDSEGCQLLDSYRPSYRRRSPMRPISPIRGARRGELHLNRYTSRTSPVRYRATSSRLALENNTPRRHKKSAAVDVDGVMDLDDEYKDDNDKVEGQLEERTPEEHRAGDPCMMLLVADKFKEWVEEWPGLAADLTALADGCARVAVQMDQILDSEEY
ncbi:hypothetical protein GE09DRAFT_1232227 [Coniochaeta sp. 2T2.1]|nr:hypothetical protein GE09DRAFT_1232227 [Coniochaeta sp. 2T2.1]